MRELWIALLSVTYTHNDDVSYFRLVSSHRDPSVLDGSLATWSVGVRIIMKVGDRTDAQYD